MRSFKYHPMRHMFWYHVYYTLSLIVIAVNLVFMEQSLDTGTDWWMASATIILIILTGMYVTLRKAPFRRHDYDPGTSKAWVYERIRVHTGLHNTGIMLLILAIVGMGLNIYACQPLLIIVSFGSIGIAISIIRGNQRMIQQLKEF